MTEKPGDIKANIKKNKGQVGVGHGFTQTQINKTGQQDGDETERNWVIIGAVAGIVVAVLTAIILVVTLT